ncbi:hypothetical protein ACIGV8_14275 [Streptomyces albidoflavus]
MRRVRTLLTDGLTTHTIARVLPCVREEGEQLVPVCADLVAELRHERERITRAVDDLLSSRTILDGVIAAPGTTRPGGG